MRNRRERWVRSWALVAVVALATVGVAMAQGTKTSTKGGMQKGKASDKPKGGLRAQGGAPPKKLRRNAADPFINQGNRGQEPLPPAWPYHYKFKIVGADETPLAAVYYPSQRGSAAVVMLVHEKGRLGRDFEDGIEDLKDKGLADYLQGQGYAVLVVDLRGHGANPRREIAPREGTTLVRDLQAAYQFLVDRHNREELNLAKFSVVGLGEGANLIAAWAATPGGAVSSEGRISDLGALVLVSPLAEGFGLRLAPALATIAPRIPVLLIAGERDAASLNPIKDAQPTVARLRQSKVEFFPASLHGYKLLRFQPKVADSILSFFESTIKKVRSEEWEPRYNLTPVAVTDIELVRKKAGGAAEKAAAKEEPAKKEEAKQDEPKKDEAKKDEDAKKAPAKDAEEKEVPKKRASR